MRGCMGHRCGKLNLWCLVFAGDACLVTALFGIHHNVLSTRSTTTLYIWVQEGSADGVMIGNVLAPDQLERCCRNGGLQFVMACEALLP